MRTKSITELSVGVTFAEELLRTNAENFHVKVQSHGAYNQFATCIRPVACDNRRQS